jgi:hypothetical protein
MVLHGDSRDLSDKVEEADALKEWEVPWEPRLRPITDCGFELANRRQLSAWLISEI